MGSATGVAMPSYFNAYRGRGARPTIYGYWIVTFTVLAICPSAVITTLAIRCPPGIAAADRD